MALKQVTVTYEDLKRQEDPVADLVDAYGSLYAMSVGPVEFRTDIIAQKMFASRILLNPVYHTTPEKFQFIRPTLDSLLGSEAVGTFLNQIKTKQDGKQ